MVTTGDPVPARLAYLRESARLLAIASPTTSSYLGAQYGKLLLDSDGDINETQVQRDARQREFCNRCGNIMVPGLSYKVRQSRERPRSKVAKKEKTTLSSGIENVNNAREQKEACKSSKARCTTSIAEGSILGQAKQLWLWS
ncbi:hypothetical protein EJ05DRAFT_496610 [Pseudovirgaria hyperparasitica]|uniref:Rpr2-domain-containing protein n=1 Tax=Pseudovirgaria hyperparasitica TaxID=470096 RepID=A0A6A6WHK1_9PEZI|nr:uncharacterized protein EJ05DRAFT_496610 [Pseudovirgaria hyperparasitica]KAF2761709.1 hypothetical protein EJ05DRAFT_496610 [Pseudovirgaria hyperparasitica]